MIATDHYTLTLFLLVYRVIFGAVKFLCSLYVTGAARLVFKGVVVPENSLLVRETISGPDNDTLMCVTDYTPCCTADTENGWYWEWKNELIPLSNNPFTMSRGDLVVRLHRSRTPVAEGIFWCRIRVATDTFQDLFVGIYGSNDPDGGDGESVKFTVKYDLSVGGILICSLLCEVNL